LASVTLICEKRELDYIIVYISIYIALHVFGGRMKWQLSNGYDKRSLIETAIGR